MSYIAIMQLFYRHELLPIVFGAHPDDYARIAPPHSYIHTDWFRSTRALAHYLQYLAQNKSAYLEYFRWREVFALSTTGIHCRLCSLAHEVLQSASSAGGSTYESSESDEEYEVAGNVPDSEGGVQQKFRTIDQQESKGLSNYANISNLGHKSSFTKIRRGSITKMFTTGGIVFRRVNQFVRKIDGLLLFLSL